MLKYAPMGRCSLLAGARIVHLRSWHQVQTEAQLGEALAPVKKAGVMPDDPGRLWGGADGAAWRWKHVKARLPHACQVLDSSHCAP